jgi:hypothetical protein
MPSMDAARSYTELRRHEAAAPKVLYAIDAHCTPESPVTDVATLTALASAAVAPRGGHVLEVIHENLPKGALNLLK